MTRDPVKSSNVKSIGYDQDKQLLEVEFRSGAVHQYQNVSPAKHQKMMRAKSIGGFFYENIRNFHPTEKVQ